MTRLTPFFAGMIAIAAVGLPLAVQAEVQLAQVFTPHAVLQRDKPLPIWGWAEPGEKIAVTLGARQAEPVADTDCKWLVKLAAQAMSKEPLTLKVVGKNTVEVPDVLLGDVWFCSGQSNMEFSLGGRGGRVWSVSRRPGASLRFNTGPRRMSKKSQSATRWNSA